MQFWKQGLAMCIVAISAVTLGLVSPARAAGYWYIQPLRSSLCVEVESSSVAEVAQIQLWGCTRSGNRMWRFETITDGHVHLENENSAMCMNIEGGTRRSGAKIVQWYCGAANYYNDQWLPIFVATAADGNDYYQLQNRYSRLCIAAEEPTTNGNDLIQRVCRPTRTQYFTWWTG